MSPTINLDVEGPTFYCPDCGRWLARTTEDGTFDLASRASVILLAELPIMLDPDDETTDAPTLMAEAVCLRRRCRIKRWLRGYRR